MFISYLRQANTYRIMKQQKFKITEADFLLANRRASRIEEIEAHGRPVINRTIFHQSHKTYSRKRLKEEMIDY